MSTIGQVTVTPSTAVEVDTPPTAYVEPVTPPTVPPAVNYTAFFDLGTYGLTIPANLEDSSALFAMLALNLDKLMTNSRSLSAGLLSAKLKALVDELNKLNVSVKALPTDIQNAVTARDQYYADESSYNSSADAAQRDYEKWDIRAEILGRVQTDIATYDATHANDAKWTPPSTILDPLKNDPDFKDSIAKIYTDFKKSAADGYSAYSAFQKTLATKKGDAESARDKAQADHTSYVNSANTAHNNALGQEALRVSLTTTLSATQQASLTTQDAIGKILSLSDTKTEKPTPLGRDALTGVLTEILGLAETLRKKLADLSERLATNRKIFDQDKRNDPVSGPRPDHGADDPIDPEKPTNPVADALVSLLTEINDIMSAISSVLDAVAPAGDNTIDDHRTLRA